MSVRKMLKCFMYIILQEKKLFIVFTIHIVNNSGEKIVEIFSCNRLFFER